MQIYRDLSHPKHLLKQVLLHFITENWTPFAVIVVKYQFPANKNQFIIWQR
jgi:hypothetical protein